MSAVQLRPRPPFHFRPTELAGHLTSLTLSREALDIRSGTELNVELLPGEGFKVTLRTADHAAHVARLAGSLAPRGKAGRYAGLTDDEAIALAAREDDARVRAYASRARRGRR